MQTHRDLREEGQIGLTVLITAVCLIIAIGIALGVYFLVFATAGARGRVAASNTARNGSNTAASYEYFHDTCHSVMALTAQVGTLGDQVLYDQAHPPSNDPFGQIQSQQAQRASDLTGLRNQRDAVAQQYNARSHEPLTRSFIKSRDLPEEIGPPTGVPYDQVRCEAQGG